MLLVDPNWTLIGPLLHSKESFFFCRVNCLKDFYPVLETRLNVVFALPPCGRGRRPFICLRTSHCCKVPNRDPLFKKIRLRPRISRFKIISRLKSLKGAPALLMKMKLSRHVVQRGSRWLQSIDLHSGEGLQIAMKLSYICCQKSWKNTKQSTTKMGSSIESPRFVGFGAKSTHGRERSKIRPMSEVVQSYAKRHTA